MNTIRRINQRNQVNLILETKDGIPCCPHCSKPMVEMNDIFENSQCSCWWFGANDCNYVCQVVVATTEEHEEAFVARIAVHAAQQKAKAIEQSERFQAAKELVVSLGGNVRISAKKSRGRGGHAYADLPLSLKGDPRLDAIPLGYGPNFFYAINFITV